MKIVLRVLNLLYKNSQYSPVKEKISLYMDKKCTGGMQLKNNT
jgi:hypothetical protein